jgi:hypothetical protein
MTGRWMVGGAMLGVLLLLLGCSSSEVPDGGPAGNGDPSDFCRQYVEAFEGYLETCGCGAEALAGYRARMASACKPGEAFISSLSQAVAAGELTYDARAASALFARLGRKNPPCVQEPYVALGLESGQVWSYAGTFTGTRALGQPCRLPVSYKGGVSDCREGACAPDGAGGGVCIALAGEGEACDESGEDQLKSTTGRLCFDERAAVDSDGEYESAFDSLSCVPSSPGATSRVCVRGLADGEPCRSGDPCRSGLCSQVDGADRVCVPKGANGAGCASHGECESGACKPAEPRVCGPLLANGEPCGYAASACQSGSCNDPDGTGGFCGPAPSRLPGEPCASSVDCITAGHGDSRDKVCHEGRCIADVCAAQLP